MVRSSIYDPVLSSLVFISSRNKDVKDLKDRIEKIGSRSSKVTLHLKEKSDFIIIEIRRKIECDPAKGSSHILGSMKASFKMNNDLIIYLKNELKKNIGTVQTPLVFNLLSLGSDSNFFMNESSDRPIFGKG
ncbi:MAG: hypothetical protein U9R75_06645, partial [Candidatus Thermoplasmatota archaeon]|nr:hypothetical protein [Candidatus Thermoplasmatota archaeon]